jgi:hypothetical protein
MKRVVVLVAPLIAALVVWPYGSAGAATVASDTFERADGPLGVAESGAQWEIFGQQCGGCSANFFVESGRARIDPASRVPAVGHAVIDTGLISNYQVEADINLSATYQRANTGLSALFRDADNHLFCKIEVTAGNPAGLLTIGDTKNGSVTSLLASRGGIGLVNGSTYHLTIVVPADLQSSSVSCTVSDAGGAIASVSYQLSQSARTAYGSGHKQGLRTKVEFDEDDTGSTWENFQVISDDLTPPPPTTPPPPPPTTGCTVVFADGSASLAWASTGATDVIRRNDQWLTTPPSGVTTYVDTSSPAGATYVIRSWSGSGRVDVPCTAPSSVTTTTTIDPATTTTTAAVSTTTTTTSPAAPTTTTTTTTTTTAPTTSTTSTTSPPLAGCRVATVNGGTLITWFDDGGTHVIRRNGSWLATPGSGVDQYLDTAAPAGAQYVLRTWVSGVRTDWTCV